jgi:hypothetical protein
MSWHCLRCTSFAKGIFDLLSLLGNFEHLVTFGVGDMEILPPAIFELMKFTLTIIFPLVTLV